jgi:hypothetical protein
VNGCGSGSKSTDMDLTLFVLSYIREHASVFRRRTNVNDVVDNDKTNCQLSMVRSDREHG